jgi:hypothetical protein
MTTVVVSPDERSARAHFESGRFRVGVAAGQWRFISLEWPYALIAISAAPRANSPTEWVVRFELTGYPHTAPTGGLWDLATNASLAHEQRPKGNRVAQLFRYDNWAGGAAAMYAAWDRIGLESHPGWATSNPLQAWNPTRDLSFVLEQVHEELNTNDYLGA